MRHLLTLGQSNLSLTFSVDSGYLIPVYAMKRWLLWVYWINPVHYGFSALLINEFKDLDLLCEGSSIVPHNVAGNNSYGSTVGLYQVCTLPHPPRGLAVRGVNCPPEKLGKGKDAASRGSHSR